MFKFRPARWRDLIQHPEYLVETSERPHLKSRAKLASPRVEAFRPILTKLKDNPWKDQADL